MGGREKPVTLLAMRLLLLALLLTSCGEVCSRAQTLNKTFPERHVACYPADTLPSPAFDPKACSTSMTACTPTDRAALKTYFDCLERLPVCTHANKPEFSELVLTCAASLNEITDGCFRPE